MRLLYNLGIYSYGVGIISVAKLGNKKANTWVEGRRNWQSKLNNKNFNSKPIWFHTSSLGEYIMSKPLIDLTLKKYPEKEIILTFFSPSGYENVNLKNKRIHKLYLPLDTKENAMEFVEKTNPSIAIFAKYDFWFNTIEAIQKKNIPTLVFAANLHPKQLYFKMGWQWQEQILKNISRLQLINDKHLPFLLKHGFKNTSISGDPRFDEVGNKHNNSTEKIKTFISSKICLVLGSSWKEEENLVRKHFDQLKHLAIIIAPHDISEKRIKSIEKRFKDKTIRYSQTKAEIKETDKVLIIDSIGLLAQLYNYSDISFVGGGFSGKLHNILEPASTNNAVLFGPKHQKFFEAVELIKLSGAFSITNGANLINVIKELEKENQLEKTKTIASNFVTKNKGATSIIFNQLKELMNYSTTSASSKI